MGFEVSGKEDWEVGKKKKNMFKGLLGIRLVRKELVV